MLKSRFDYLDFLFLASCSLKQILPRQWTPRLHQLLSKTFSMAESNAADEKAHFFSLLHEADQIDSDDEEDEGFNSVESFLANAKSRDGGSHMKPIASDKSRNSSHRTQGNSRVPSLARESQNVRIYKSALMAPPQGSQFHRHEQISRSLSFLENPTSSKVKDTSSGPSPTPPTLKKTTSAPPLLTTSSNMSNRKRTKKGNIQLVPE